MADSELREALNALQNGSLREALDAVHGRAPEALMTALDSVAAGAPDAKVRSSLRKAASVLREVPREVLTDVIAKVILGAFGVR